MTMQAMVDTLVEAGFDVEKVYDKFEKGYRFTISKNDKFTSALFEYPADTSWEYCDKKQREFIEFVIDKWRKDHKENTDTSTNTKKKMILFAPSNGSLGWDFMKSVMRTLSDKGIHSIGSEHEHRFRTPHTRVWCILPGEYGASLDGIQADAIFGHNAPCLLYRAKPGAVIGSRDGIGLVDYICQVEQEARKEKIFDMAVARMLNSQYGKFGQYNRISGLSVADMYPTTSIMPWRNGKSLYRYLMNATYGITRNDTNIVVKGENNMNGIMNDLTDNKPAYIVTDSGKVPVRIDTLTTSMGEATRFTGHMIGLEEEYVRNDVASTSFLVKNFHIPKMSIKWRTNEIPDIKHVHFSGPCTVVIWADGTKTIVRCENEELDPEKGLAMAIAKKAFGTNKSGSNYYDIFKKWLPKTEREEEPITEETVEEVTDDAVVMAEETVEEV